jgi:hypothetical protein
VSGPERLRVSAEVAAVVGAEDLALLEAKAAAEGYQCAECGQWSALAAEPAAVIVRGAGPGIGWARIAHERCSPSRVAGVAVLPDELAMTVVAGVIPHASGPRAVILAEPSAAVSTSSEAGDRVDLVTAGLISRGLHLITRAGQRPPAAPGWTVHLPSPAEAVITGPAGTLLYEGTLIRPPLWQQIAAARGGDVELLVGMTGLAGLGPATPATGLLTSAAKAGRLVGGMIRLS